MKSGKRLKRLKFEVYMLIKDRKRLARLIEIQEVSKRQVAEAAGWKSHTYLLRLLNGQAASCKKEPAILIATFLGVDLYDLFLPKVITGDEQGDTRRVSRTGKRQAVAA